MDGYEYVPGEKLARGDVIFYQERPMAVASVRDFNSLDLEACTNNLSVKLEAMVGSKRLARWVVLQKEALYLRAMKDDRP